MLIITGEKQTAIKMRYHFTQINSNSCVGNMNYWYRRENDLHALPVAVNWETGFGNEENRETNELLERLILARF